jgi:hypothetical protein
MTKKMTIKSAQAQNRPSIRQKIKKFTVSIADLTSLPALQSMVMKPGVVSYSGPDPWGRMVRNSGPYEPTRASDRGAPNAKRRESASSRPPLAVPFADRSPRVSKRVTPTKPRTTIAS